MKKKLVLWLAVLVCTVATAEDPETVFLTPPPAARPAVWWHWMGCNVTSNGVLADLDYFQRVGIGSATVFGLSDTCSPWAASISNSPTAGLRVFSDSWWALVRFAAMEAHHRGIDLGVHNCPGYTSTGGPWIPSRLAMRQLAVSGRTVVEGAGTAAVFRISRPVVGLRADALFPLVNGDTGAVEKPEIPARRTDVEEIAVLAFPAGAEQRYDPAAVRDLSATFDPSADTVRATLPPGRWRILRICHVPMGAFTQPNPWEVFGLECDKMNPDAVNFHLDRVLGALREHLGTLVGTALTHVLLDSYEAGTPNWTPRMREEFASRRGYELTPFLPVFAGFTAGTPDETARVKNDVNRTIHELYRDVLFKIMGDRLRAAGLSFACEPYGGPFDTRAVIPFIDTVMTEFWSSPDGSVKKHPGACDWEMIAGPGGVERRVVEAEAFTGQPENSCWDETPWKLKAVGDSQFCRGVNRFRLHSNPLQPWPDTVRPGMTMGRWGTHFGRTQTWAEPATAYFSYLTRCQALLQWGRPASAPRFTGVPGGQLIAGRGRTAPGAFVFFIANLSDTGAVFHAVCPVTTTAARVDWFDPVTGRITPHPGATRGPNGIAVPLELAPRQSGFLVFRAGVAAPAAVATPRVAPVPIPGPWTVRFDPAWGGPAAAVVWTELTDWTTCADPRVRYYSGTAVYRTAFDWTGDAAAEHRLELGNINGQLARVRLNGRDAGVVWCAPWTAELPAGALRTGRNELEIEFTNVWANRLIGDEQEPADCAWRPAPLGPGTYLAAFPDWFRDGTARPSPGRRCFTTWNYFTKDTPLVPSGLLGPVSVR